MDAKKLLSDILGFYKYKVDNDLCTMEEMNGALNAIENNMAVGGTISDLSKHYNVPESNIRATIARKLIAKPKRRLLYPFEKFAKIIPDKWRAK